MREKERKYCYGMYTLMFLLMCMAAFLPFFMGGKNFVWGAGVEDGLSQHFSALAYYGELLREFVKNLIAGHPKLMMWNMSLGRCHCNTELLCDWRSTKSSVWICTGKIYRNHVQLYDPVSNVFGGNRIYFVCKKDEEENVWNSDRGISVCLLRILFPSWTAPSIFLKSNDLFSIALSWN